MNLDCSVEQCSNPGLHWGLNGYVCNEHRKPGFYKTPLDGMYTPELRLLYFIYSSKLKALKVGVGQYGRLYQLTRRARVKDDNGSLRPSVWRILKVAGFGSQQSSLQIDSALLHKAEKNVLAYWFSEMGQSPFLDGFQMGVDSLDGSLIGGASETVRMGSVCEFKTWSIVENSEGYLGERLRYGTWPIDVTPRSQRKLQCLTGLRKCECN